MNPSVVHNSNILIKDHITLKIACLITSRQLPICFPLPNLLNPIRVGKPY